MSSSRLLYCNCAYAQIIPKQVKTEVLKGLVDSGVAFDAVADLCEMSAQKDPALKSLAEPGKNIKVAACFPRAIKWLFHAAEAPLPEKDVEIFNMRNANAQETVDGLLGKRPSSNDSSETSTKLDQEEAK